MGKHRYDLYLNVISATGGIGGYGILPVRSLNDRVQLHKPTGKVLFRTLSLEDLVSEGIDYAIAWCKEYGVESCMLHTAYPVSSLSQHSSGSLQSALKRARLNGLKIVFSPFNDHPEYTNILRTTITTKILEALNRRSNGSYAAFALGNSAKLQGMSWYSTCIVVCLFSYDSSGKIDKFVMFPVFCRRMQKFMTTEKIHLLMMVKLLPFLSRLQGHITISIPPQTILSPLKRNLLRRWKEAGWKPLRHGVPLISKSLLPLWKLLEASLSTPPLKITYLSSRYSGATLLYKETTYFMKYLMNNLLLSDSQPVESNTRSI